MERLYYQINLDIVEIVTYDFLKSLLHTSYKEMVMNTKKIFFCYKVGELRKRISFSSRAKSIYKNVCTIQLCDNSLKTVPKLA
jgi:hypothetical protein